MGDQWWCHSGWLLYIQTAGAVTYTATMPCMQTRQSTNRFQPWISEILIRFCGCISVWTSHIFMTAHFNHPYFLSIFWCSSFSLRFSSSSLQLSDCRAPLCLRDWPIISRFSSSGSGAGCSSTHPKCTWRKKGFRKRKKSKRANKTAMLQHGKWYIYCFLCRLTVFIIHKQLTGPKWEELSTQLLFLYTDRWQLRSCVTHGGDNLWLPPFEQRRQGGDYRTDLRLLHHASPAVPRDPPGKLLEQVAWQKHIWHQRPDKSKAREKWCIVWRENKWVRICT